MAARSARYPPLEFYNVGLEINVHEGTVQRSHEQARAVVVCLPLLSSPHGFWLPLCMASISHRRSPRRMTLPCASILGTAELTARRAYPPIRLMHDAQHRGLVSWQHGAALGLGGALAGAERLRRAQVLRAAAADACRHPSGSCRCRLHPFPSRMA